MNTETFKKVSIVIPVYNEALAIREVLRRVGLAPIPNNIEKEIIIVDDGSIDSTLAEIQNFIEEDPSHRQWTHVHKGLVNHGKGAAIRAGLKLATGDVVLIQDGDLEYSPQDYPKLLEPFFNPDIHVVYGSRFLDGPPQNMKILNLIANYLLTWTVRIFYRQHLTDEATAYKVIRKSVLDKFKLKSRGFEFCPEITSLVLKAGYKIHEVKISYNPRGILEGKKIKARDGFIAMWWLMKLRLR